MTVLQKTHLKQVSDWDDWKWHMKNRVTSVEALEKYVTVTDSERQAIKDSEPKYRWSITPHYASLMDPEDPRCPIRLQAVPQADEMRPFETSSIDPVGDTHYRKTARVVHKYRDRIIFLVNKSCPVYCRHCTRKYHTTEKGGTYLGENSASYDEDIAYIEQHPEIRDVLLTGGDPLMQSDDALEDLLTRIRAIKHVEIVRIGSRFPVLLPQRITPALCKIFEKVHPFWLNTHFNHPKELTKESAHAVDMLLRHGVPVQNQSVLLKGINDSVETMRELVHGLLKIRVRPYYLYQCDDVAGVSHFVVPVEKGREIVDALIGHTTGFAAPQYVFTTWEGKVPLSRDYLDDDGESYKLKAYTGKTVELPRPRPNSADE